MIDLNNIRNYTIDRPDNQTLFGNPEDFDNLPEPHKAQILFLDKTAGRYIHDFFASAKLVTGKFWEPFAKGNFKEVEQFSGFLDTPESSQVLKKWLFNREIAFRTWVFVLPNYNDYPILTTWKMVIKYSDNLFGGDDVAVFDSSLNWCLFYHHEEYLFFGKDKIYNPEEGYKEMQELIEKKKKYPGFKLPY